MKILMTTFLSLSCSLAFATKKVDVEKDSLKKRGVEESAKLSESITELNARVNRIIESRFGGEFALKLPEGLNRSEMRDYTQKITEMSETLEAQKLRIERNENNEALNIRTLLGKANELYEARTSIVSQIKAENKNWTPEQVESAQTWVKLVDNFIRVLDIKIGNLGSGQELNYGTILQTANFLLSAKTSGMKGEDFVKIDNDISRILPKDYNARKAAECIKEA